MTESTETVAHRHAGGWIVLALALLAVGLCQGVCHYRPQVTTITEAGIALRVNVNTATIAELCCIPHVGPGLAERIVAYRQTRGPFRSLSDLDQVPGIGPSLLEEISQAIEPLDGDSPQIAHMPSSAPPEYMTHD